MRFLGFIIMFFSLVFAAQAQTADNYDVQPEQAELSKSVHIFPNPATEYVNVRLDFLQAENVTLTVHNIIGNEVPVETERVDTNELRVRVKDLVSGYYLLAIKDEEDKFRGTYKFLKR